MIGLAAPSAEAGGGTLRTRMNADIRSTDPGTNRDANTDGVVAHMVEGLVAFRDDTSIGPMLADSWTISEDGKTYTFKLRPGVKFHNGATMTSDDVVWSFKRWLDPATQWRCLTELNGKGFAKIEAIEAPDARHRGHQARPAHRAVPRHDRAAGLRSDRRHSPRLGRTRRQVDCTGRHRPVQVRRMEARPVHRSHSLRRLFLAQRAAQRLYRRQEDRRSTRLRINFIPDSSAAKAGLLSGSLDVIANLSIPDLDDLKARTDVQVSVTPALGLTGILLQTTDPLLQDVRIRRALALSLDTKEIVDVIMQGTARANNSALPIGSPFYSAVQAQGYTQNIAEAKKLLTEAGYKGQPIKMIANKRYTHAFDSAVLVQAMAQAVGIKIDIEVLDWAAQLDRYNKGDYQAMAFPYSARLDPSLSFEMLTGPKATQPRKVWDNPQAQEMLRESMLTLDAAKRQALFDEMHRRFIADVPMIVLFNGSELAALRSNVKGYAGWLYPQPRFWGVSLQ